MLGENIRKFRREKGYSQEELAACLHVVRQTVSKWEKGLSMPDAELLMDLASVLEVPVETLLGVEGSGTDDLCAELARVNTLLAEKTRQEAIAREAGKSVVRYGFYVFWRCWLRYGWRIILLPHLLRQVFCCWRRLWSYTAICHC